MTNYLMLVTEGGGMGVEVSMTSLHSKCQMLYLLMNVKAS